MRERWAIVVVVFFIFLAICLKRWWKPDWASCWWPSQYIRPFMLGSQGVEPTTAVYGAILLHICSQLVKATTNYQQGQVWYIYPYEKKPLPAHFPFLWPKLSHLKARAPCSPSKKNLLDITASVHYHPALLSREDAGLKKKKKKPLRQQHRERNIYRLCVIQTVIVIPANKPSQTGFKGGVSPPAGGYTMRASIIYKRSTAMIMFQAR